MGSVGEGDEAAGATTTRAHGLPPRMQTMERPQGRLPPRSTRDFANSLLDQQGRPSASTPRQLTCLLAPNTAVCPRHGAGPPSMTAHKVVSLCNQQPR